MLPGPLRACSSAALALAISAVVVVGCAKGDPGYAVVFKNESDVAVLVRGDKLPGKSERSQWLLPPRSAGLVLYTLGAPRDASPIDFDVVDQESCRILGTQHVDFALASNPGFSEFTVVFGSDRSVRVEAHSTADQTVHELDTTTQCAS